MRPMNLATPKQVAALKRLAKGVGWRGVTKSLGGMSKRASVRASKYDRVVTQRHYSPEPGVEIVEASCYLPSVNETNGWYEHGQKWRVHKHKKAIRGAVTSALNFGLPKHALDKSLRDAIDFIVLSRIAPPNRNVAKKSGIDSDNHVGSMKAVLDTVCAWLEDGPTYDIERIGEYDSIVRHDTDNPDGRLTVSYCQDIRPVKAGSLGLYGCKIELHAREK